MSRELDRFEAVLEEGLLKVCGGAGFSSEMTISPDIEEKWDEYVKDYVADAVDNYNDYPEAAIGFAGFLGMAVAHGWDIDWDVFKVLRYSDWYGSRGFDDMDDHIVEDILKLDADEAHKVSETLKSCALAAEGLMRHEGFEAQTADGFYAMVRSCTVLYRIGASMELYRLGYRKQRQ